LLARLTLFVQRSKRPSVLVDVRLDVEAQPRDEMAALDFALGAEVTRLMTLLDKVENGKITKIEVRAGLPRRVTLEARNSEAVPAS
jgi:hypothetical protein